MKIRVVLLLCIVILAVLAYRFPFFKIDLQISQALQGIHQPIFSGTMNVVSELGDDVHFPVIVGLIGILLFFIGLKMEALKAVIITTIGAILGSAIKHLVNRPRPPLSLVKVQETLTDKSFPSLHVLLFTVFFGYLLYLSLFKIKIHWLKILIASASVFLLLTIGLSRIYLGEHWASDTLGGYLIGSLLISFLIFP